MSGGVAFLLDLDERPGQHELVELAPVNGDAAEELAAAGRRHLEETGSPVAEALLDDWANAVPRFTEVMPSDYKLVLAAKEKAEPRASPTTRRGHPDDGGSPWLTRRAS